MECPLTKADMKLLRQAIAVLRDLDPHLEMAVAAKLDVDEQAARHSHLKEVADAIIETYGKHIEM